MPDGRMLTRGRMLAAAVAVGVVWLLLRSAGPSSSSGSAAALDHSLMPATPLEADKAEVYYAMLRRTLLASCPGDLCRFDVETTPGPLYAQTRKAVQCGPLMVNPLVGLPAWIWPPVSRVPAVFLNDFTMGGRYPLLQMQMMLQRQGGSTPKSLGTGEAVAAWTEDMVEYWKSRVPGNRTSDAEWRAQWDNTNNYGYADAKCLYDAVSTRDPALSVKGKRVAVIGSIKPWVEGILLAAGATHITTIEYGAIKSSHPQVDAMTPLQLAQALNHGAPVPQFDGVVTYSSIEHSGLGRYGDELNPWGDIMATAQIWCMTKPGGFFHVAFEMSADVNGRGKEGFFYNIHRLYGKTRLPHVLTNWEYRTQTCPNTVQPTLSLVKLD